MSGSILTTHSGVQVHAFSPSTSELLHRQVGEDH